MNYRQIFESLLQTLKKNPLLEVTDDFIGDPIPADNFSFAHTLEYFKIKLPKKLLSLYHSMNSCSIEWQCNLEQHSGIKKFQPDDGFVSGRIKILPVEEMLQFNKKLESSFWQNKLDDAEKKDLQRFRYIDFNDDFIRVGFLVENNTINANELFFITQDSEGLTKTNLKFDTYIEKMILYKGYQGWQYNYFFNASENNKRMNHYLSRIFEG